MSDISSKYLFFLSIGEIFFMGTFAQFVSLKVR